MSFFDLNDTLKPLTALKQFGKKPHTINYPKKSLWKQPTAIVVFITIISMNALVAETVQLFARMQLST
ncbi:MAG: hypothetical protein GXO88_03175 [Chlorobi bacterium]|nr:hypothetical protein [Chlorobiota bacterium]